MKRNTCSCVAIALLLLLALSGCSPVFVSEPLGEEPYPLQPGEWEGEWLHEDGLLVVRVLDEREGTLLVSAVEERDGEVELETLTIVLRQSSGWVFVMRSKMPS